MRTQTNTDELTAFDYAMADIKNIPVLTREEEYELGLRILDGDKDARDELVVHNLRWAAKIAISEAQKTGFDEGELYSEACRAMINAASSFDCRKDIRFTTYSKYACEAAINRYVKENSSAHSISQHDLEDLAALKKLQFQLHDKYGENTPMEALVAAFNATHKRKLDIAKAESLLASMNVVSYEKVLSSASYDDGRNTLSDKLPADVETPYEDSERDEERNYCMAAINSLEPRKAEIVRLYCGFDCDNLTHSEIGQKLGISSERSRQLFKSACVDLMNGPFANGLSILHHNSVGDSAKAS